MADEQKGNTRRYIVMRLAGGGEGEGDSRAWVELRPMVEASNDQMAIRAATKDLDEEVRFGMFVAVPQRSFRPRTRKAETVQREIWS